MERLTTLAKPGALMIFAEPVNFNQDDTPNERQLEFCEIEILRRYIPDLGIRHFLRLGRFTLVRKDYEDRRRAKP